MNKYAPKVREVLLAEAREVPDERVALLLSGGIDSSALLFSLLSVGKKVTAYTFMLDGRLSTDFKVARQTAKTFGVDFVPVFLPTSIDILKRDLFRLANLGARKKTQFECFWPMLYAYETVRERAVFSGLNAGLHFCLTKKGMIHQRHDMEAFRRRAYSLTNLSQEDLHNRFAASLGKQAIGPYRSKRFETVFSGSTWNDLNKPKPKQPIYDAFPRETQRVKIYKADYQLGDSGIQAHFLRLLETDWNLDGWKNPVGIYNAIRAGRIRL